MSKVITFSVHFPSYHPLAGQETFFEEGIRNSLSINWYGIPPNDKVLPKNHTVRGGDGWKVGDKFSPRKWSGRPYHSAQVLIGPDIEIKKIWDIKSDGVLWWINNKPIDSETLIRVATNDGLNYVDFLDWFRLKPFAGQIICWKEDIVY